MHRFQHVYELGIVWLTKHLLILVDARQPVKAVEHAVHM